MCVAVSGGERGFPAHSACAEHQRGWEAEDNVRNDLHQGSCKKADVDMNKRCFFLLVEFNCSLIRTFLWLLLKLGFLFVRAGELTAAELDSVMTVVANPRQFKIPNWFLNRKKDYKDGKYSQVVSNALDMKLRDDLERLKKIRSIIHLF